MVNLGKLLFILFTVAALKSSNKKELINNIFELCGIREEEMEDQLNFPEFSLVLACFRVNKEIEFMNIDIANKFDFDLDKVTKTLEIMVDLGLLKRRISKYKLLNYYSYKEKDLEGSF